MIARLAGWLTGILNRFYPDPLVFLAALTGIAFFLSIFFTSAGPGKALAAWGNGLTLLLAFTAQIAITLIVAHALAHTRPIARLISRLAEFPRNAAHCYILVAFVSCVSSLIAWSLGLVVGALIAGDVARSARRRGIAVDYALLVATAYAGLVVWHMGYTGTAPLSVATPGHPLESQMGLIDITETMLAPWNVMLAAVTVVAICVAAPLMHRETGADHCDREVTEVHEDRTDRSPTGTQGNWPPTLAERLDGTPLLPVALGLLMLGYLAQTWGASGFTLTLDLVNWSLFSLVLLCCGSARECVRLVVNAGQSLGPILVQYPLYAGIIGLMSETGLVAVLAGWFSTSSTNATLPLLAFLCAGLVNLFIPSGGAQWAVQGPVFVEAAIQLDVPLPIIVMAIAYGDQWTNLIQPFWTIPLLAIAGLTVRQIIGYTAVFFLLTGCIFAAGVFIIGNAAG